MDNSASPLTWDAWKTLLASAMRRQAFPLGTHYDPDSFKDFFESGLGPVEAIEARLKGGSPSFTPPADLYHDLPTGDYTSVVEARHDRQQGFLAELRQQRTKAEDKGDQKAADLVSQTILDARDCFEQQNIDFYKKQRGIESHSNE